MMFNAAKLREGLEFVCTNSKADASTSRLGSEGPSSAPIFLGAPVIGDQEHHHPRPPRVSTMASDAWMIGFARTRIVRPPPSDVSLGSRRINRRRKARWRPVSAGSRASEKRREGHRAHGPSREVESPRRTVSSFFVNALRLDLIGAGAALASGVVARVWLSSLGVVSVIWLSGIEGFAFPLVGSGLVRSPTPARRRDRG